MLTTIQVEEVIRELENAKKNAIPPIIGEMNNMDEWYEGWDLAFDIAIKIIKRKKGLLP
jgi:hypothetical protein